MMTNCSRTWVRLFSKNLMNNELKDEVIIGKFANLRDNYRAPKYPIVLCHGLSGFDSLVLLPRIQGPSIHVGNRVERNMKKAARKGLIEIDYWYGVRDALEAIGTKVLIAKVDPFAKIEDRAKTLNRFIQHECEKLGLKDNPRVNLISHSMGGLDCRYLISKLEQKSYEPMSLTTVSTPHHGSECADFLKLKLGTNQLLSKYFPSISQLTTESLKRFNEDIQDDPNVKYFSYGARFIPKWYNLFYVTWHIMNQRIEHDNNKRSMTISSDNDGLVSVNSSKWGTYLGTLDQVDHLDLINWTNRARTLIDRMFLLHKPNFNAIALYLDMADTLSRNGL